MLTTDRFFSFRRLLLLMLVFLLTGAALAPASTSACTCTNGAVHVVYVSVFCCGSSRQGPQRPALMQTCQACEWSKPKLACFGSSGCLE